MRRAAGRLSWRDVRPFSLSESISAVSVAGFIAGSLCIFGAFIALWFGRAVHRDLRSQVVDGADGTRIARLDDAQGYWRNIYLEGALALWGVLWAIMGIIEYFGPNPF
jgi:hypothetical protein